MYRGLKRAAILADGDPELDVLVLTGTGEWFGTGGDMSGASRQVSLSTATPGPRSRLWPMARSMTTWPSLRRQSTIPGCVRLR